MASNRLQITKKTHDIGFKTGLSISVPDFEYTNIVKNQSHSNSAGFLQMLFSMFANDEKNTIINNESKTVKNTTSVKDDETQSLLDLENCANAARESEGGGQYEWINSSDE